MTPGHTAALDTARDGAVPPCSRSSRAAREAFSQMTVNVVRRARRRASTAAPTSKAAGASSFAIGELDQTVFDCPSCARPLALGARRCPGCRTRLLNGVSLGKASGFVTLGVALGLLLGAGGGFAFGLSQQGIAGPAAVATASASPGASPSASPSTTAASVPPPTRPATAGSTTDLGGITPLARSSLEQSIGLNDRLVAAEAGLRTALAAPTFDASAVAQILRTASADSVFGGQLAERLASWPGTTAVGAQLGTFYGSLHDIAGQGLVASVQNQAAYRAAAGSMVKALAEIPSIDVAVRAAANSAGVPLPSPASSSAAPEASTTP